MIQPRYPIYIPSLGRWKNPLTANRLMQWGIPFFLVIEPQEAELYRDVPGQHLLLPFQRQGLHSTRDWIWRHAQSIGATRFWQFDDNIREFYLRKGLQTIPCDPRILCSTIETFADSYANVGIAGPEYFAFTSKYMKIVPMKLNCHVYSASLILATMTIRYRDPYNDDTDLCLQALASGFCTALVPLFVIDKAATMTIRGGNTSIYMGNGRLAMAESLARRWPGIVAVKRRFGRPQHVVDWTRFKVPLESRPDIVANPWLFPQIPMKIYRADTVLGPS